VEEALLDGISRLKGYSEDSLDKDDLDLDADSSDEESELAPRWQLQEFRFCADQIGRVAWRVH
jgi:hypothetical protein